MSITLVSTTRTRTTYCHGRNHSFLFLFSVLEVKLLAIRRGTCATAKKVCKTLAGPKNSLPTSRVSIEIEDSLFVNLLIDEEDEELTYFNVLHHGDGHGSVSVSNSCFGTAIPYYNGAPFVLKSRTNLEAGFDINSDLLVGGNYFRTY
jgi:hypothetical protein